MKVSIDDVTASGDRLEIRGIVYNAPESFERFIEQALNIAMQVWPNYAFWWKEEDAEK